MSVDFNKLLDNYTNYALYAMSRGRGLKVESQLKRHLIANLAAVVLDAESVDMAMTQLPPEAEVLLALLRQRGGTATISSLEAQAQVNGVSQFDSALHELMRRALVLYAYAGQTKHEIWPKKRDRYYGYRYVNPQQEVFAPSVALERVDAPEDFGRVRLERYRGAVRETLGAPPDALLRDVLALVRHVRQRKVRVRKSGGINEKDVKATAKQFEGDEDECVGKAGFLYATLMQCGFLCPQDERLQPADALEDFLTLPLDGQVKQLFEGWIAQGLWSEFVRVPEFACWSDRFVSYDYNDIPDARSLQKGRRTIIGILKRERCVGDWFSFVSLLQTIKVEDVEFLISTRPIYYYYGNREATYEGFYEKGRDPYQGKFKKGQDWEKVEGRFIARVLLEPLRWLGMVALAVDGGEVKAFRLTDVGAHILGVQSLDLSPADVKPFLVVQPNFEIIAYASDVPTALLFQLEKFADRVSSDKVGVYRVTRESVYRGMQMGMTGKDILNFLTQHSQTPVPQNIAYSLDDWQRLHERVSVHRNGTLVEADSEEELDKLLAQLPSESFARLTPTWALVNSAQKQDALKRLAKFTPTAVVFDYTLPIAATFTVTEDLEIEIPRNHLDLFVQGQVEGFADYDYQSARLVCYKITRESVQRTQLPFVRIMEFLERHAQKTLPANVRLSIRGWAGLFHDMALDSAITLATKEKANLDDIMAVPHLCEMFVRRVSDHVAVVKPECAERLRAELEQRGIEFSATVQEQVRASHPEPKPPLPPLPFHTKPLRKHRRVELATLAEDRATAQPPRHPTVPPELQHLDPRETRQLLEQAIAENRRVMIDYYSQHSGQRRVRKVDPLIVYSSGNNDYLEGYCHLRKDDRVFKVSNIMGIQLLDDTFDLEDEDEWLWEEESDEEDEEYGV